MTTIVPTKAIHNYTDFESFKKSQALTDILDFVKSCAEAAVGTTSGTGDVTKWPIIPQFVDLMNKLYILVDEVPPIKQPMRFGNKAFREWHAKMLTITRSWLVDFCTPLKKPELVDELAPYFAEMFGNPTRIDYGTGHELNFAVLFLIMVKVGMLGEAKEALSLVLTHAFVSYLRTMRRLQTEYMLEPAGSHGVWGLDDYHCLVFLWGSAQLSNQHDIRPADIHNAEMLKEHAPEYLYFEGIQFIKQLKSSAPFSETSPMLNDISGLHDWAKICSGLMRLFQAEVLNKFPVIQHLLFGSVLQCTWTSTGGTGSQHNSSGNLASLTAAYMAAGSPAGSPGAAMLNARAGSPSTRMRAGSPARPGGIAISAVHPPPAVFANPTTTQLQGARDALSASSSNPHSPSAAETNSDGIADMDNR